MGDLDFDAYADRLGLMFDLPLDGLAVLADLRRTLDRVESLLVVAARRNESTWQEVGEALGVSRQTAHTRHAHPSARPDGDSPCPWA